MSFQKKRGRNDDDHYKVPKRIGLGKRRLLKTIISWLYIDIKLVYKNSAGFSYLEYFSLGVFY